MLLMSMGFWDIVLCNSVDVDRRFRGVYCFNDLAMMQYALLKRQSGSLRLHGAISQQVVIFVCLYVCDTVTFDTMQGLPT
jgi:hypothetical protein